MLVAGVESGHFLVGALRHAVGAAVLVERGVHSHHDVLVAVVLDKRSGRPDKLLATHDRANHLDRQVGRALERAASAQLDDLGAALGDIDLHLLPLGSSHLALLNQVVERSAVDAHLRSEHCHLLAVATIGGAAGDLALHHAKVLGQCALQAGRVEASQCGDLRGLQARVEQRDQPSEVGGVEDDDHMLHIRAILLDVLAQPLGNLAVALEQVLAGHAGLAGGTTAADDVLGTGESLGGIGGGSDLDITETTLTHLLGHTLGREHIIQADIICQPHHQGSLNHV